jgi:hypothetical protein
MDWRQGVVSRGNFEEKIPVVQVRLEKEEINVRE